VPYQYQFDQLLEVLEPHAPKRVDELKRRHRVVENGLMSVGIKLHFLGDTAPLNWIIQDIGCRNELESYKYRLNQSSFCMVLHPVGSARRAIYLLEAIELAARPLKIFDSKDVVIQVCSPGRLYQKSAAILAVMSYLGSDKLRYYRLEDLRTTFSEGWLNFTRGRRLVLYDAEGTFETGFEWWRNGFGDSLHIERTLPFKGGRTDILTARSRHDVWNINLIATLLMHEQRNGYWKRIGKQFIKRVEDLLEEHQLSGLIDVSWLTEGEPSLEEEAKFLAAFQELMSYAFDEAERLEQLSEASPRRNIHQQGILWQAKKIIDESRRELVQEVAMLNKRSA
jgi:hypothetical protein